MLFAANYLAFSSKTPRVLLLNTFRFAADCTACWIIQFHILCSSECKYNAIFFWNKC